MVRVPIYQQSDGFCAPTSLRMSLAYYGVEESEENLARLIGVNPRDGCGGSRIVEAGKKKGFLNSFYKDLCSINQLREYCKEFPVIVNWMFPEVHVGHYSIAMEVTKRRIYLAEPREGEERIMSIGEFMTLWYDHIGHHPRTNEDFIVRRAIVIKR